MNTEIAEIMSKDGTMLDWAAKVAYQNVLSAEEKEISECIDAWARELGKTGFDKDHEISQMVRKALTRESVMAPSEVISMIFDELSIGEADDWRGEKAPKNTIQVVENGLGANVDASFVDHTKIVPTWHKLQARTYVTLADLRNNGYKTIANLLSNIRDALENQKIVKMLNAVDTAITKSITESGTAPTATSADALAVYLHDVSDGAECSFVTKNAYATAISVLDGARSMATDSQKNQFNKTGIVEYYAGCRLFGLSGTKKTGAGDLIIPDKRVFGFAGKIGNAITRGENIVLQDTDSGSERINIKVSGYEFGTAIDDIEKVAKIVVA